MGDLPEYWATFSIYDFRTPRLRQALVLFDKIVVPIPDEPIKGSRGEITAADIERLWADVDYLESAGLAKSVVWSKAAFNEWRELKAAECTAMALRDRVIDTRVEMQETMLKELEKVKKDLPTLPLVMPVFDDSAAYNEANEAVNKYGVDVQVLQIAAAEIPMPADDEDLAKIVELRSRESFKVFLPFFRAWQDKVAARILDAEDPERRNREIRTATLELKNAITRFRVAVEDAKFAKVKKGFTLASMVGGAFLGDVEHVVKHAVQEGPELLDVRDLTQKWWRPLLQQEFVLAGVICEAQAR